MVFYDKNDAIGGKCLSVGEHGLSNLQGGNVTARKKRLRDDGLKTKNGENNGADLQY